MPRERSQSEKPRAVGFPLHGVHNGQIHTDKVHSLLLGAEAGEQERVPICMGFHFGGENVLELERRDSRTAL